MSRRFITVLVVDDHPLAREGLRVMLQANEQVRVIGEAANGLEALACVDALQPMVVLMDVRMPGLDGLETTRRLKAEYPSIAVIMLTSYEDHALVVDAVRAGASGYLLKDASRQLIDATINVVTAGGVLVDATPRPQALVIGHAVPPLQVKSPELLDALTEREQMVLQLLADGQTNKEIGDSLGYAEVTVKKYVQVIFAKLDVSDRTHAAIKALRLHLIV